MSCPAVAAIGPFCPYPVMRAMTGGDGGEGAQSVVRRSHKQKLSERFAGGHPSDEGNNGT